jgi:hypothetical protein
VRSLIGRRFRSWWHNVGVTGPVDTHPAALGTFVLVPVRRRDVRRLIESGPPPGDALPAKHGGKDDPRYPSPHSLRFGLGFTIDLLLHLACAVAVAVVVSREDTFPLGVILLAAPATFIVVSVVHRIFVQRTVHTTLGKALTGVRYIRDDTGGSPTLGSLTKAWFTGALMAVLNVLSGF